ncbi:MAG: hypothetical protein ACP59X_03435 [Solidesulfovibrio sp. DCME]|uniref:hypothetical protein n=1 Tax=Solidesulfovibrio sp. DCME TaxID=3447380 RepID=UPI003D09DCC0
MSNENTLEVEGPEEDILETNGEVFYFTKDAIECLNRWVFLEVAETNELDKSFLSIISDINLSINNSESRENKIGSYMVKIKIEVGDKAILLQSDLKYTGRNWKTFIDKNITPSEAKTLQTYMRIARAEIDPKYYYFGTYRINKILSVIWKNKDVNFNKFIESCLDQGDEDIIMSNEDEYIRHLAKRLVYYTALNALESKKINLSDSENEQLKEAVDNNYKLTNKDAQEIAALKGANGDVEGYFKNKKIAPEKEKPKNELTVEAELANFREVLLSVVQKVDGVAAADILAVESELRDDIVLSLERMVVLLNPSEDEQG